MISFWQLLSNVIFWDRFLGVKTERDGSGFSQSRIFQQKEPPVSQTDTMKFANF